MYAGAGQMLAWRRGRIYYGSWGTALFQSIYQPANSFWGSIPQMPEWYLVLAMLGALSVPGSVWWPMRIALPLFAVGISLSLLQAGLSSTRACFTSDSGSRLGRLKLRCLTAWLHLLQPLARLSGRLQSGLTPWRSSKVRNLVLPRLRVHTLWEEQWRSPAARLESVEAAIRADGMAVRRGGNFDRWDLEIRGGTLGAVRLRMAIEEHGAGRQLVRFRSWPRCLSGGLALTVLPAVLSTAAGITRAWVPGVILGVASLLVALRMSRDCAAATGALLRALKEKGIEGSE